MKKCKILGIAAVSALMLTGCIDAMPDMTAEQSGIVAEYAAGLLLKYSPNYEYMLVSDGELKAALLQREIEAQLAAETSESAQSSEEAETKESKEPMAEETKDAGSEAANPEESEAAASETVPEQQFADAGADIIAELGIDEEASLRYKSFEICDSYPKGATGFSGVEAANGKKLLVAHFEVENGTDKAVECALYNYSISIRATVNGEIRAKAKDVPMMTDDMASYDGELGPGAKAGLAAVFEIAEMADGDINSLDFSISSSSGSCAIKIK